MLSASVCTRSIPNVCHTTTSLNVRQPLRWQHRHAHTAIFSKGASCRFRAKRCASAIVCSSDEDSVDATQKSQYEKQLTPEHAAAVSCTSLALFFPILLSHGGDGDGRGGSGGGGGDGEGNGGNAQGDSGRNVIADIAEGSSEEDDEDEDEDEEDEAEEEDEEDAEQLPSKGRSQNLDAEEEDDDDDDDEDTYANPEGGFLCHNVVADGLPKGPGIPTEDELFAALNCQPGFPCTRQELGQDLKSLLQLGLFDNVDVRVQPLKKGKSLVRFIFKEKMWPEMQSFKVAPSGGKGQLLIPPEVVDKVLKNRVRGPTGMKGLAGMKNIVEKWYHDHGFVFAYIRDFEGMDSGRITANVVEGKVNKVDVVYVDDNGNKKKEGGQVPRIVVTRELPFNEGQLYNVDDGRKALRDIFALNLFENVQVMPRANMKDDTKVDVDVMVKERPMKTTDVELSWELAPNSQGIPVPADPVPGGSLTFENRNLAKKGNQFSASVTTQNFLVPNDDIGFKVDYRQPYCRGTSDPFKTALEGTAFNNRKQSGVFVAGPNGEEVPAVWVDRAGAKIGFQESRSRNSKASYSVVLEEITTRDEQGSIVTSGTKATPTGHATPNGPPTTHSKKGKDRVAFLQANVTRDATHYVNGTPIGARDQVTVDQSLGLGIMPFFNKHSISLTRFINLTSFLPKDLTRSLPKQLRASSKTPPLVLVLSSKYAGCVGDLASYDLYTLGGPYSVRGYNLGELASARRIFEGAAELRVPVPKLNTHAYGFFEHGTDLGSSKEVVGNPTQFFRRAGSGSSVGVGLKLAAVRTECIWEGNTGKRSFWAHFGERF